MPLHRLISIGIGVPEPALLDDFYRELGLSGGDGSWGGAEQPAQIQLTEAPYRQLRSLRVGCEGEEDLATAAQGLDALGVKYELAGGQLRLTDPINRWEVIIEPAASGDIESRPKRTRNGPGQRPRLGVRAEVITEDEPRPPRRLGHVVVGSHDPLGTPPIYQALGFRVSDVVGGFATFMRCSPDHHNLLIVPGRVPYLNHYALEHDDFDSLVRASTLYLTNHEDDRQVAGPGRHQVGGNEFWYMKDPSGNFFEFFSDMDRIADDAAWEIRTDWDPASSWSIWGANQPPEIFFNPVDMDEIVEGWEKTLASA